jgi:hypothetical protein
MVAQAFVKQIKNDGRVSFLEILVSCRELGGSRWQFLLFFLGVTHQIEFKKQNLKQKKVFFENG